MDYGFLSKTALFNGITAQEIESLLKCTDAFEKNYVKDEIILHAGNPCECMGTRNNPRRNLLNTGFPGI